MHGEQDILKNQVLKKKKKLNLNYKKKISLKMISIISTSSHNAPQKIYAIDIYPNLCSLDHVKINKDPEKKINTVQLTIYLVFIFDWDDTILCTTYLSSFQFLDIGPDTKSVLEKLDECSYRLLDRAKEKGQKIFIITNAAKGWVEYSSKM